MHQHPSLRPQGHVYTTLGHLQDASVAAGMRGGREEERKMKQQHRMSGSHSRKSHGHHHHRDHHHHKHREHRKTLQENNYDVPVTYPKDRGVGGNPGMEVFPNSVEEIYSTPRPSQFGQFAPWHSTPCYDVPPAKFDSFAMPSNIVCNSTLQQEPSDAGKMQSSHNPNHQRRAHRSKRNRAYNLFETNPGNDISVEYKGRMPKKNSTVAQSCDSGVNCIGLPKNRQYYMEEPDLHVTQEASAYLPSRQHLPSLADTTTTSLMHHDVFSIQRGTPYTSMENRHPEGCSQNHPVINTISPLIPGSTEMCGERSPVNKDAAQGSTSQGVGEDGGSSLCEQVAGHPRLDERSECEGVSQTGTPLYMAMSPDTASIDRSPEPDRDPETSQYVTMSYCDSSMGEDGAGAGEVMLCQAEINQFQIPQLVLDTESRFERGNLSSEPDIALSSAGSKDTLDRTHDDSERSVETVLCSSQPAVVERHASGGSGDSASTIQESTTATTQRKMNSQAEGEGKTEGCAVSALGSEFQEMGVVDSGFSSPRNQDNKEIHQQQLAQGRSVELACYPHQKMPGAEVVEEVPAAEHKSKHERIKAFVKQSNQLLEQRQFTMHGNVPLSSGNNPHIREHDMYASYPSYLQQHKQYNPFSKPLHPADQEHHPQSVSQQTTLPNNQRHHHHTARPQSVHGSLKDQSKALNVWQGQGHSQGQAGGKILSSNLKAFQEQQLRGKKFGMNGEEFEVVGVVWNSGQHTVPLETLWQAFEGNTMWEKDHW